MDNKQLDNLIKFCFLFHTNLGSGELIKISPDYLNEKYEKLIGIKPKENNNLLISNFYNPIDEILINRNLIKWHNIWNRSYNYNELKEILFFLYKLNTRKIYNWSLFEIIQLFKECLGIDVKDINTVPYNHIHKILRNEIDKWVNLPINNREYKLNIVL